MNTKDQVKNHLEYLGYDVEYNKDEEDLLFCSKQGYPPMMIHYSEHRIQFWATYDINEIAKKNPVDFLEYVNMLNMATSIATFYINEEGNFNFASSYLGSYDRKQFASFLHLWENDVGATLDRTPGTARFLGSLDNLAQESYDTNTTAYA